MPLNKETKPLTLVWQPVQMKENTELKHVEILQKN